MIHTLVNLFAAPKLAFEQLRTQPSWVVPMLLLLIIISGTTFAYFHFSNPEMLMEDMLAQASHDMSEAERAEARENLETLTVDTLKWITTAGGSVGFLLVTLLHAGYFALASMFSGTKIAFKSWLGFVTWSSLPIIFALIAGLATLFFATGHVTFTDLNPLSLTNLLNFKSTNLDLVPYGLMILGYRIWTQKSWLHSSLIVLTPLVLWYGGSLAMAL